MWNEDTKAAASNNLTEVISMIIVAVDVAKDKHDCFITNTDGEVLYDSFAIQNNQEGFEDLYQKICSVTDSSQNVKVGLEATGHYHLNLLGYLLDKGFPTCLINPLQTSLFRKSLSFRKTKTDPVDARAIARLLMSDRTLQTSKAEIFSFQACRDPLSGTGETRSDSAYAYRL